jgi:CheY-specific phosphatase CheX
LNPKHVQVFDLTLSGSTEGLFEAYGLTLTQLSEPTTGEYGRYEATTAGIIGFGSPEISGSLVIAVPERIVKHTLPTNDGVTDYDWVGELSNQLLGRVKNQLLKYGVVLSLALPVVVKGRDIETPGTTEGQYRYYAFSTEMGPIVVRLEVSIDSEFEFQESTDADDISMEEGELSLF